MLNIRLVSDDVGNNLPYLNERVKYSNGKFSKYKFHNESFDGDFIDAWNSTKEKYNLKDDMITYEDRRTKIWRFDVVLKVNETNIGLSVDITLSSE